MKPVAFAFFAAVLVASCGEAPVPTPPKAAGPLATGTAELREVELSLSAEAVVEAVRQSTVSAQVSGRIVDIRFDVGDRVQKGDVIVRIDERAASQAVAASANSGAICWQGPHQGAQKSTSTGTSVRAMKASNEGSSSSTTVSSSRGVEQ